MENILIEKLLQSLNENQDVALVTIIDTDGSSPRGKGSMMLVDQEGKLIEGTIGGGAGEERAKRDAADCIKRGISKSIHYAFNQGKGKDSVPMICGGNIDVFIKVFRSYDKLLIIGAGHISLKLSKIAKVLGYHVTIVDDRKEFASKERFPEADQLKVGDVGDVLRTYPIDKRTSIVIVSHGHKDDEKALEAVIDSQARYIGMIGSNQKVKSCFNNLGKKGISNEEFLKVYSPIGLDIGGETPEEISLAIMAEIQSVKYNKEANSLKIL